MQYFENPHQDGKAGEKSKNSCKLVILLINKY